MKRNFSLLLSTFIFLFNSCQNDTSVSANGILREKLSYEVIIDIPAGQSWTEDGSIYLASPFNISKYKDIPVLVLANRLKKGKKLDVHMIGAIKLKENNSINHYVIAIPTKGGNHTHPITEFSDLITSHSSIKWIIEQYLLGRHGLSDTEIISWEEESYVVHKLFNNNI